MAQSFLVLTPHGAGPYDDRARFIADDFSRFAFIAPSIWLLTQRQWLAGIAAGVLQLGLTVAVGMSGAGLAGLLAALALRLFVALEGRQFIADGLMRNGWQLAGIVPAATLGDAEHIYFHTAGSATQDARPGHQIASRSALSETQQRRDPAIPFGLFGQYGER